MSPENCRPQTVLADAVIEEISVVGKDLGFGDVDSTTVRQCLDSHSQPPIDMDLRRAGKKNMRLKERGVSQRVL
jgi:hypothetical protein